MPTADTEFTRNLENPGSPGTLDIKGSQAGSRLDQGWIDTNQPVREKNDHENEKNEHKSSNSSPKLTIREIRRVADICEKQGKRPDTNEIAGHLGIDPVLLARKPIYRRLVIEGDVFE